VIGDDNASVGTEVTFWGSQWAKDNVLSFGGAPSSFKGFAASASDESLLCVGSYTTGPGDSNKPPATIPTYIRVLVASAVSKNGSTITGDIVHIVIVRTNPGYAADPGHPGTGTVVAGVC
jgi:hypothetical protein